MVSQKGYQDLVTKTFTIKSELLIVRKEIYLGDSSALTLHI